MTTQPTTGQPPSVEERLSRLEGGYDRIGDLVHQVESLRTDMSTQVASLRADMNTQFESMRAEINTNARTTYVLLSSSWLALMLTTVGINFLT